MLKNSRRWNCKQHVYQSEEIASYVENMNDDHRWTTADVTTSTNGYPSQKVKSDRRLLTLVEKSCTEFDSLSVGNFQQSSIKNGLTIDLVYMTKLKKKN